MKIMLRNSSGKIFTMDVNAEDTLHLVKNKLQIGDINFEIDGFHVEDKRFSENDTVKHLDEKSRLHAFVYQTTAEEAGDHLIAETSEVLKCLVPECGIMRREQPNKHFFSLPTNEERLHHWLMICRRTDLIENIKNINNEHYGICEDHFIGDNFVDNSKCTLKSEAIPTIFNRRDVLRKNELYGDEIFGDSNIFVKEEDLSENSNNEVFEEKDDAFGLENTSQLCRLCATSINDVVYIFNDTGQEQQIAKKINSCLPVTVRSTDPLPKQLCMSCMAKLNLCHEFAEACIQAEDKLLRLNKKNFFTSYCIGMKSHGPHECVTSFCCKTNEKNECRERYGTLQIEQQKPSEINETSESREMVNESVDNETFCCPLCNQGSMSIKKDFNFANGNALNSNEIVSDTTKLSDVQLLYNNEDSNSIASWDNNNIDVVDCERPEQDSVEIKREGLLSNLINSGETNPIAGGMLICRICGDVFGNIDSCLSHADSHFAVDFYPCNVCDLCFTTLSSFKSHCEKEHLNGAKLKTRAPKRIQCNHCGRRFNSENTWKNHVCGSSPRPFKCEECGKSFLTEVRLLFHQQIHQGGSSITCEHCGKMFSRENNLFDHVRLVHMGEKAHCCDQCGKTFQLKARLIAHQRVHSGERPFECDVCGGKFYDKATLKGHRLTHLDVKPFQCEKCGRCFARKTLFKQHTIAHLSEQHKRPRTFACRLCAGAPFASYAKLVEHRKEAHPDAEMNEVDEAAAAQAPKPFKCDDCGKSFAYRVTLVAHRRNHTGELPFECDFCAKRFSQKRSLILHRRIHTGEKPFACVECGKRFVQSAHLYSHARLHTGEKPYACEVCGEAFRLKDVRDAHQRKHTGERPFKCGVCAKAFRTSHSYYQHMWIHQGKKPYPCTYCGKAFRRSNGLKIHIRIHTGEKPHACDICGRSFAQKQDMKKHRNLHGVGKL